MKIETPHAILFDWDNTLVDTFPIIIAALTRTFEAMGVEPWSEEDIRGGRQNIHHSLRDSFPLIFGDRWEEARAEYYKHFLATHLELIRPIDGAASVLSALRDSKLPLGVVSNKTGKYLREEIEHLGWNHYFSSVVGATDAAKDKPHAEPVLKALEHLGLKPSPSIWLVGDTATDLEAALNAGITPVLFGDMVIPEKFQQDTRMPQPLLRVENHTALFDLVRTFW